MLFYDELYVSTSLFISSKIFYDLSPKSITHVIIASLIFASSDLCFTI